ncbi:MAG: hypothetical protein KJ072_28975, partial [Verrucomicrobia bacterium]|nr:hypothetical protein [Verrucomicrobiota bacterium]
AAEEGALIGAIVFHYADGSRHELEIFYGRHVRHWWTEGDPRTDTDLAQVAWDVFGVFRDARAPVSRPSSQTSSRPLSTPPEV